MNCVFDRSRRVRAWFCAMAACLASAGFDVRAQPVPESTVKAAAVLKLVKFVAWPGQDDHSPLELCVCADDRVFEELTLVSHGQKAHDRTLAVRRAEPHHLAGCDVVFLGPAAAASFEPVRRALGHAPVLTIGEVAGFAQAGGMVNMVREGRHLRLEVNRRALRSARLEISALVLALAEIVDP
jgi:hypothetical protein